MITIKLPYTSQQEDYYTTLETLRRQQSSLVRYCYSRFKDGVSETDLRKKVKVEFKNINLLDSWYIGSAILEAKRVFSTKKENIIFGGKNNWDKYVKGKITKEEFKQKRLMPLFVCGESNQNGNRKFNLDITNNKITFKHKCGEHYSFILPKLKNTYLQQLLTLEKETKNKQCPYFIKLDEKFIYITFEEFKLPLVNLNLKRVFSIDMNPNEIGYSILEFNDKDEFKIIDKGIINNEKLNVNLIGLSSSSFKKIKQTNKRKHETYEISKFLINKAVHCKCSKFVIEDLNIESKNHNKGKGFNRLINNNWLRSKLEGNLKKRCNINNIEFLKVNSAYSSFVGNVLYSKEYPDPICSAIEIGRRGYKKFVKGWFYPKLVTFDNLPNQWKKEVDNSYKSWLELYNRIKKAEIKYHFSWQNSRDKAKFLSFKSNKSGVSQIII